MFHVANRSFISQGDMHRMLAGWLSNSDLIVSLERQTGSASFPKATLSPLHGSIVHKMWLPTAVEISPSDSRACVELALNVAVASCTLSAPVFMSKYRPAELISEESSSCLEMISENLDDVRVPVYSGRAAENVAVLKRKQREQMPPVHFPNRSPMCTCSSDRAPIFVDTSCHCGCAPQKPNSAACPEHVATSGMATVLLMSYRTSGLRSRVLAGLIHRYLLSPEFSALVAKVIYVWNGPRYSMPDGIARLKHLEKLQILPQPYNSLNNRWLVSNYIATEAVLVQDDDIAVSPLGFSVLLAQLERSNRARWVTPFVREVKWTGANFLYQTKEAVENYSLALPRVGMISRSHIALYSQSSASVRDYVDSQAAHCDDILMNLLVHLTSGQAPLRSQLPPMSLLDFGNLEKGIVDSANGKRRQLRTSCLNELMKRLGLTKLPISVAVLNWEEDACNLAVRRCPRSASHMEISHYESVVNAEIFCQPEVS